MEDFLASPEPPSETALRQLRSSDVIVLVIGFKAGSLPSRRALCGTSGDSTKYADRLYKLFGAHFLKNLMRNLAELDWRLGSEGESGLKLLDGVWTDIYKRFRSGDEFARASILSDLTSAAIYQPEQVIRLVRCYR